MSDSDSSEASDDNNPNYYVTLGKSSDFETVIWRFPNTKQCPLKECKLSCSSRSVAFAHFHMHHAEISMICTICDELFLVLNPLNLLRHCQIEHPNERPPKLKASEKIKISMEAEDSSNVDHKGDILYHMILTGCGQETRYCFPNTKICPNRSCNIEFKDRFEASQHFRNEHAQTSIFCYICQKPLSAKEPRTFIKHYHRVHGNIKVPYDFENMEKSPPKRTRSCAQPKIKIGCEDENLEDDEDLILLNSRGITTTWRFGRNLSECPISNCRQKFRARSDGIAHFKKFHAIGSICCPICDKPVRSVQGLNDFRKHYACMHPGVPVPFNSGSLGGEHARKYIGNVRVKQEYQECHDESDLIQLKYGEWRFPAEITCCPVKSCSMQFDSRIDAMTHYRQRHASSSIYCHLCSKPIRVDVHKNEFIRHFQKQHPNLVIPYGLGKTTNQCGYRKFARDDDDIDDEYIDDLIELSACGITTYFRMTSKQCPVSNCRLKFERKSEAIAHYTDLHSKGSLYCPLCSKPIRIQTPSHIKIHFERAHPYEKVPFDLEINSKDQNDDGDLITLTASGRQTFWRYPKQDWKNCPAVRCHLKFETRRDAISHYKLWHSQNAIACPICRKPIVADSITKLKKHYLRLHSEWEFPNDIGIDIGTKANGSQQREIKEEYISDDENEDDLIRLTAHGRVTFWRFPKDNWQKCSVCSNKGCKMTFETRQDSIQHYKKMHSEKAIACPICPKAIRQSCGIGNLKDHFERCHPNEKFPSRIGLCTKDKIPLQQVKVEVQDEDVVDEGDFVKLTTGDITTVWRFPADLRQCPVTNCRKKFRNRLQCKKHYRESHANGSICCPECQQPIRSASNLKLFYKHFKKMHPFKAVPFNAGMRGFFPWKQEKHQAQKQVNKLADDGNSYPKTFVNRHSDGMHSSTNRIYCPLKLCTYEAKQMNEMRTHWNLQHRGMEFPELRDETSFAYGIDSGNQKNVKERTNSVRINRMGLNGECSSKPTVLKREAVTVKLEKESSEEDDVPLIQVRRSNERKTSSGSSVWFTGESDADDEPSAKKPKKFATSKKRQRSSSSISSTSSIGSVSVTEHLNNSRKVAKTRMYHHDDDKVNGMNASKPITANKPRLKMQDCSVLLEPLNVPKGTIMNIKYPNNKTTSTESLLSLTSNSSNEVFYVADSDEEVERCPNGLTNAGASTSGISQIRQVKAENASK